MHLLSSEHSFLCGLTVASRTICTPQLPAQVVVWYAEIEFFITLHWNYGQVYGSDAPDTETIKVCFDRFVVVGCVLKQAGDMHWSVSKEKVEEICTVLQRSPSKSICQALRELYVTGHRVPHKQLHLFCIKRADYQGTGAKQQTKVSGLHYWHAASDQYGS
jgi:hypothetical protein